MIFDFFLLVSSFVGHGCLLILALNVIHGLGLNARWMDDAVLIVLAGLGLLGLYSGWTLWGVPWTSWPVFLRSYSVVCLTMIYGIVPIVTCFRLVRKSPEGVSSSRVSRLDLASEQEWGGTGKASILLRVPGNRSLDIHFHDHQIAIAGLPEELRGFSILHLTDIHLSNAFQRAFFERVVSETVERFGEVDLIAITGDFLDDDDAADWISPVFRPLKARLGKFAILGNHDFRHDVRRTLRELNRSGFTMLEGRWDLLETQGIRIAVGGTSAPWGRLLDPAAKPDSAVNILLSHTPDRVYEASRMGFDLMLSGHVHGGQVRLPVIGPILMPSVYSRRFDRGFFQVGKTILYVNQGIAGKHPLRLGDCHPEVTRLTLVPVSPSSQLVQTEEFEASSRLDRI